MSSLCVALVLSCRVLCICKAQDPLHQLHVEAKKLSLVVHSDDSTLTENCPAYKSSVA